MVMSVAMPMPTLGDQAERIVARADIIHPARIDRKQIGRHAGRQPSDVLPAKQACATGRGVAAGNRPVGGTGWARVEATRHCSM